jgi:uncharacterized protein (DUF433 family)
MFAVWPEVVITDKTVYHHSVMDESVVAPYNYDPYPLIVTTPGICGGEPRITGTRLSVRILADLYWQGEAVESIAAIYEIAQWEVERALDYATSHREEIEGLIHLNATA